MKEKRSLVQILLALGLLTSFAGPAWAQVYGGAAILHIKPGGRATGMGRAGVGIEQRAHSTWWNPALLAQATGTEYSLTYAQLVPDLTRDMESDVYYMNLGAARQFGGGLGIGIDMMYLSYGKTEGFKSDGTPCGEFTSYEMAPSVGAGLRVLGDPMSDWYGGASGPNLDTGLSVKYVRVDLADDAVMQCIGIQKDAVASAWACDLGGSIWGRVGEGGMFGYSVSANVQNLSWEKLTFINSGSADPMPHNLKAGVAGEVRFGDLRATGVFDYNKSLINFSGDDADFGWGDTKALYNMGAEGAYQEFIFARMGYIHDTVGEITAMTFGFGVDTAPMLGGKGIKFDYASVPQAKDLERVHYLSLGVHLQ